MQTVLLSQNTAHPIPLKLGDLLTQHAKTPVLIELGRAESYLTHIPAPRLLLVLSPDAERALQVLQRVRPLVSGPILQHEMALGKSAGESMQKFGQRCGLEEVRTLASVLLQNERYGVSVPRALRVHADAMRQHRALRAEEMAQKAAVKILFPTLLCIFPAVFIVVLGPAAFRIMAIFARMR